MTLDDHLRELVRAVVREELEKRNSAQPDEYLSTSAAAEFAKVTSATIRRWIKAGNLTKHHAGRVIRVSRVELESLLKHGAANDELTPEQMAEKAFG